MNLDCGGSLSIIALIGTLFQYIEDHIKEPITLEQLSHSSSLSTFQLIRLFNRFTGMTPIAYIRARRLAGSMPQLLAGDTVLSVALERGFEHEQSYIRAFCDTFGITPARFRRLGTGVAIVDVPNLERFTVSADGMVGRPKLLVRPAFTIAGELRRYHYLDNILRGKGLLEEVEACVSSTSPAACRASSPGLFRQQHRVQSGKEADGGAEWLGTEAMATLLAEGAGIAIMRIEEPGYQVLLTWLLSIKLSCATVFSSLHSLRNVWIHCRDSVCGSGIQATVLGKEFHMVCRHMYIVMNNPDSGGN